MSYIKRLWLEEGLYPTEDYDFSDIDEFENDYDFSDIDEDAPVTGNDDGEFNFGSIDDEEPEASGDYNMNAEPDSYNYDFYDIDTDPPVTGDDDYIFNFGTLEKDSETATKDWDFNNNNPIEPDPEDEDINFYDIDDDPPVTGDDDEVFNFGDLNLQPECEFDFYDIDTDPPVTGDDDEVFNFGDIDTDPESFVELDWNMELDVVPVNLDEIPEEDVGPNDRDWDFGEAEDDEEYTFDFMDIEEYPDMRHSQFDFEYDFGYEDEIGWIYTRDTLHKYIRDSIEELTHDIDVDVKIDSMIPMCYPYIIYQYFYNEKTNKSYIQYRIYNTDGIFEAEKFNKLIRWKIESQFKYDTGIWPVILNVDVQEINTDNVNKVTPYTIGYWENVDGNYEVIEDRSEVELYLRSKQIPPTRNASIMTMYDVAYAISKKYDLMVNNMSKNIKDAYIKKAREILTLYHTEATKKLYDKNMTALNRYYNYTYYNNDNIPAAVKEYMDWYQEFFGVYIPDINTYTRKRILKVVNI